MVETNSSLLVHIGYHKTATSWLQEYLFGNEKVGFSAFTFPNLNRSTKPKVLLKSASEALWGDKDRQELGPFSIDQDRLSILSGSANTVAVVSNERLSGSPHTGGYDSDTNCKKIRTAWPHAKIFIVVREQKTLIQSCYYQYLKEGGTRSLAAYISQSRQRAYPAFSLNYFNFIPLIDRYIGEFGRSSVLVLPWELFRYQPESFISRLLEFAELPVNIQDLPFSESVNVKRNPWLMKRLRFLNLAHQMFRIEKSPFLGESFAYRTSSIALLKNAGSPLRVSTEKEAELSQITKSVGDRYKEGNTRLQKEILPEYDLRSFGYDLGKI
tara:strand:+ start:86724 stop:87701 length:978 start_codon:yes stop_codon:yes gene_type:complete